MFSGFVRHGVLVCGSVGICLRMVLFFAGILSLSIYAQDYSKGVSWPSLEQKIDPLVENLRQEHKIVGMTVAVSWEGRLIHSKGYGYAKSNKLQQGGLEITPMLQDTRTRIGSVTKAVITGPVAYQLMKEKGLKPQQLKLYGANGILGYQYRHDQEIGTKRFFPIVAMAISPNDEVITWYTNRQYSKGSSNKLHRYKGLSGFVLPDGYLITDIQAIAISKSNKVYVWYRNGKLSVGTPGGLGRYEEPDPNKVVTFPSGKSMLNVVGIAIAKSNDRVYVWYDDGTRSVGDSFDFAKYEPPKPYSTPSNTPGTMSRYDIRGIGISSKDWVYVWYSNNNASSGSSLDLDKYRSPYAYAMPDLNINSMSDQMLWWDGISIKYLLTHRSGFQRSGDTKGTSKMFGIAEKDLTYELVHKHFLRTRKLRWFPGLVVIKSNKEKIMKSYSNHGFGLWALLVPRLTGGQSYRQYAIDHYLRPLQLKNRVRPMTQNHDIMDADPYTLSQNKAVKTSLRNAGLGLAAGGWTASAKNLLWITRHLVRNYTVQEMKDMGWGSRTGGKGNKYEKLHHSGLISGGMAYVVIFPMGYISRNGKDLGDVHVAIATNTSDFTKNSPALQALETLSGKIALAVADAGVPQNWNIWGGFREIVRHGIQAAAYPFTFEHGYRPIWIDGYTVNGKTYFNVIFHPDEGIPWVARHGLSANQYQAQMEYWSQQGYRPLQVESYRHGTSIRYAVIFVKKSGPAWRAYHGITPAKHQQLFNTLTAEGYRPINISVVSLNGNIRVTALYEKKSVGSFVSLTTIPANKLQQQITLQRNQGRGLAYLNAWRHNGKLYFTAIWNQATDPDLNVQSGKTRSQFLAEIEKQQAKKARTQFVVGYKDQIGARFVGAWIPKAKIKPKPIQKLGN